MILDECKDGFDQDTIDRMKSAVQKFNEQEKQKGATKERLSVWQKYFINGEYLRSAEMAEEQNYNMIDGRINNLLPKKENPEVPKKRKSVLCVCINTAVRLQRNRESQCRGGIRGWRWSGIVNR